MNILSYSILILPKDDTMIFFVVPEGLRRTAVPEYPAAGNPEGANLNVAGASNNIPSGSSFELINTAEFVTGSTLLV